MVKREIITNLIKELKIDGVDKNINELKNKILDLELYIKINKKFIEIKNRNDSKSFNEIKEELKVTLKKHENLSKFDKFLGKDKDSINDRETKIKKKEKELTTKLGELDQKQTELKDKGIIKKHIEDNILKHFGDIEINYNLEFIQLSHKEQLIQYLIVQKYKNELDKTEESIYNNLYNVLEYSRDVYYKDPFYNEDKNNRIFGYKILDKYTNKIKYKKFNSDKIIGGNLPFDDASTEDIKNIQKSFGKKSHRKNADLVGYLEFKGPSSIIFKIRDSKDQGSNTKGTQIKTGSICNNDGMSKNKIIEYIEKITGDNIYSKYIIAGLSKSKKKKADKLPIKSFLCKHLELLLRFSNNKDSSQKWFYNLEETIEYEINTKKI